MDLSYFSKQVISECNREGVSTSFPDFYRLVYAYRGVMGDVPLDRNPGLMASSVETFHSTLVEINNGQLSIFVSEAKITAFYAHFESVNQQNTQTKKVTWFRAYRDIKPFKQRNSMTEWYVWNLMCGTLDNPTPSPDTTLLGLL